MARCYCHWGNVLFCICAPCICLVLLFLVVGVMMCTTLNDTIKAGILDPLHFVAPGTYSNGSFAPLPKTFWDFNLHKNAYWNRLQLAIDHQLNPILRPNRIRRGSENSIFDDSLLSQSFSEVNDLDSMRKHFDKMPDQMKKFVGNMNKRDYPVLLQPNAVCGAGAKDEKEPPLLLLAIKTTEVNFKNRQAIRRTWGQEGWVAGQRRNNNKTKDGGYVRRVFLLGKENPQELGVDLSALMEMESKHYGDILQWDFSDTFFNLTLKDVLFWNWFSQFCNQTLFVFKGDDDIFINTPRLISYLQDQLRKPQADKAMIDFMVGDVIRAASPNRVNRSKYFIPDSFYKGTYPTYAGGGGVVYSGLLTKRLNNVSKRVHLFPIDDVFVGMCMVRLNANPIHHHAFLTFDFPAKDGEKLCAYHTILLVHKRNPIQLFQLWADLKKTETQCWDTTLRMIKEKKHNTATVS
ncbi:N-acetyllactosaminide beta-1,3-N-acetylglucosaminyltransferase 2 [Scomber japonicus]|uniref:N-acetyllactosaminide beta-1,3-N-acetylglucosaminyltransferase 2 n=1 Tax=Scomber japonicus TaxID=13676 RepID=UPI0023050F42|nr:N-acetyllactosaminide beta-1,3-N-acetylglucosaminyltransferase 2 [Scomber japonicus]